VCSKTIDNWSTCGDTWGPWANHCCRDGSSCRKVQPGWWRCEPGVNIIWNGGDAVPAQPAAAGGAGRGGGLASTPPPPRACCHAERSPTPPPATRLPAGLCFNHVKTWSACGGSDSCPRGVSYCDQQWAQTCCAMSTDKCVRQSSKSWRCEPQVPESATGGGSCIHSCAWRCCFRRAVCRGHPTGGGQLCGCS